MGGEDLRPVVETSLPMLIDERAQEPGLNFVLRLGQALHRYGVPAHRLEQQLSVLSTRFGLSGRFYSTPTAIIASFGKPEALRTCMIRVDPGEVDLERLARLDELTTAVMRGECDFREAEVRLEAILDAPQRYGPKITVAAFSIASGGAAYLLGGGIREVIVALAISLITGLFSVFSGRMPFAAQMFEGVGAFVATALAIAGTRVLGPYSIQLAVIAGIIVLMPGLTLTVALTEIATRNLMSGTSRLMHALMIFLQMGFGVALGGQIGGLLPPIPDIPPAPPLPGWIYVPALLLGVGAFAVLFRARPKDTVWIILGGSVAFFTAGIASKFTNPQLGAFVGSLVLCMGSNALARLKNKPSVITILPGLLLIVPGSVGFRSLDALLERNVVGGLETAFTMVMVATGIVAGHLLANSIVPPRKVL